MLSAVIQDEHSYPALPLAGTTGAPEVHSFRSSRTRKESSQAVAPTADRDQPVSRILLTYYYVYGLYLHPKKYRGPTYYPDFKKTESNFRTKLYEN